ncbi:MAG: 3-oxoadipate enol-lactonase [Burkholderiales bacterium]
MKINTNGIEINYEISGNDNGPWVTLSHSLACNLHMWDDQMAALNQKYKVLRFDTRGHGLSSAPPGDYTLEQMADDVKGLFDALGIQQTHWIGLSMGGMIGQTFALKYPGVFQSLVLADTTSRRPPNAEQMWGERVAIARAKGMAGVLDTTLARWFTEPYRNTRKDVMARIGADILNTPVDGFSGACVAISKVNTLDRLKEIQCPVFIIVGEEDHGTPPEMARAIHENLPGSELLIIESAAHLSNVEQAEVFTRAAMAFLGRISR